MIPLPAWLEGKVLSASLRPKLRSTAPLVKVSRRTPARPRNLPSPPWPASSLRSLLSVSARLSAARRSILAGL